MRRDYEAWFDAPARAESREVTLLFASQAVTATLRRLDNESGSVQMRYQSQRQRALREWLNGEFGPSSAGGLGQVLEFDKVERDVYRLTPVVGKDLERLHLSLGPGLYHNNARSLAESSRAFPDIAEVVCSVEFRPHEGQMHYNEEMRRRFLKRGWNCNEIVVPGLPLRADFKKDDVQVEVEFGNARSYYQDYLKFLLPFTRGMIRLGVLLVPTSDFARLLCLAGTRRAIGRMVAEQSQPARQPKYSGMITYEKVEREFDPLRFILNMPLIVRGIDFWDCA